MHNWYHFRTCTTTCKGYYSPLSIKNKKQKNLLVNTMTCVTATYKRVHKTQASSFDRYHWLVYSRLVVCPLTVRVAGAARTNSQPVSSIFLCFPTALWDLRTPDMAIPWWCLPTSSSVCLVFFPLSLCFVRWFWPDRMNGRHDHTTAVCVSLRWSGS